MKDDAQFPRRRYPAKGVWRFPDQPTVVFVTVCTRNRVEWLANQECHDALKNVWREANAWLVGRYVVMPDHVHLFAAPGDMDVEIETWVKYWKAMLARRLDGHRMAWQRRCWHHRLRNGESYAAKWAYVADNPVRRGLVERSADWPFQGEVNILSW